MLACPRPSLGTVPEGAEYRLGWELEKGMGPSDRNVLEVQGLTVRFDTSERSVVAVKELGCHVRAGEVLAIVGESGSGKSVTSLSVMRLIEHGGGTIA